MPGPRLLNPGSTAAVVFGAHDWTEAGLSRAPSFRRSAKGILHYLIDSAGLGFDPDLVLDLFDDTASAGEQLARIRDTLDPLLRERRDEGRPVTDLLVYYVGHGHTDDQNHLSLLVRRSRRGMEAETGIKAPDLARVLKVAAPQQRRVLVLDCCFSEAAATGFIGQAGNLDQAVAATAAKDLNDDQPQRGTLLLCSSPVGEVSMGPPNAQRTLFTGAVLDVLQQGAKGKPPVLSFADLRDAAYHHMVVNFGANAPRPVLHQVNAAHGDLTRTPAFPNRASRKVVEGRRRKGPEKAQREAEEKARHEAEARAQREAEEKARHEAEARARHEAEARARHEAEEKAQREAEEKARHEAEARARHEAEARARHEAKEKAQREAEERARREAEERARRQAAEEWAAKEWAARRKAAEEWAARREAEEKVWREAKERAGRGKAEEKARREAEERAARREAEEKVQREAERPRDWRLLWREADKVSDWTMIKGFIAVSGTLLILVRSCT